MSSWWHTKQTKMAEPMDSISKGAISIATVQHSLAVLHNQYGTIHWLWVETTFINILTGLHAYQTVSRTQWVSSSAFVVFLWRDEGDWDVLLAYHDSHRAFFLTSWGGKLNRGNLKHQDHLPQLLLFLIYVLHLISYHCYHFFPILVLGGGTLWKPVHFGCIPAAGWDYDLSMLAALFSWHTWTHSVASQQERAVI